MQAVVNEKINLAQAGKQIGKAPPAGTFDVGPSTCMPVAHCCRDLLAPMALHRWKVDTPEMTVSVPRQRLQDEARGDAVSDTGLDYLLGSHVANQTPDRPH